MATGLSLEMDPAHNPLPDRYFVRVVVLRSDGRELTAKDEETIRAAFPAPAKRAKKSEATRGTKKKGATRGDASASSGAAKPSPKRAAAKRPTR